MTREEKVVLVVDASEARRLDLIIQLSLAGHGGAGVATYAEARRELERTKISALVLSAQGDMATPALSFAKEARSIATTTPLLLIGDQPEVRAAAASLMASVISQSAPVSDIVGALRAALGG